MDCNYIKDKLFAIAENRLPEAEAAEVSKHIAACTNCASVLASFARFTDAIEKEKHAEYNPYLSAKILHKLESADAQGNPAIYARVQRIVQPVLAVTLIVLAVLTGLFAGIQGKNLNRGISYKRDLNILKTDMFVSELNDEDKTLELYK